MSTSLRCDKQTSTVLLQTVSELVSRFISFDYVRVALLTIYGHKTVSKVPIDLQIIIVVRPSVRRPTSLTFMSSAG